MAKKRQHKPQVVSDISDEQFIRLKARQLPIGDCYKTKSLETCGKGYVIVTRKHPKGQVTGCTFFLDTFCLGVKGALYFARRESDYLDEVLHLLEEKGDMLGLEKATYEEAHNLIYGVVAFAEEVGIKPCKEYAIAQYVLEEDTEEIPLIEYEFGKDGKYFLMPETDFELNTYLPILQKNLGDDFDWVYPEDEEDDDWLDEEEEWLDEEDEEDDWLYEEDEDEEDDRLEENEKEEAFYFGDRVYPAVYENGRIPHLISLLGGKKGHGFLTSDQIRQLLSFDRELLMEEVTNYLRFMKGSLEGQYLEKRLQESKEDYKSKSVDNQEAPLSGDYSIINGLLLLSCLDQDNHRTIINDWAHSCNEMILDYLGSVGCLSLQSIYLDMAKKDLDYVCSLIENYNFFLNEMYIYNALAIIAKKCPQKRNRIMRCFNYNLDFLLDMPDENLSNREVFSGLLVNTIRAFGIFTLYEKADAVEKKLGVDFMSDRNSPGRYGFSKLLSKLYDSPMDLEEWCGNMNVYVETFGHFWSSK